MAEDFTNYAKDGREAFQGTTILADGHELSCDTWRTGLNNNMLVVGPSGAGKTRNVLKPNVLQMASSMLIMDTKGSLYEEVGPQLAANGYEVWNLDFTDVAGSIGYNPLDFIRRDARHDRWRAEDILTVSAALIPIEDPSQPFWERAARNYLASYIAYVMEQLPEGEHNLASVVRIYEGMSDDATARLFEELEEMDPDSYAFHLWKEASSTMDADRMHASILGILAEKMACLNFPAAMDMYLSERRVDFVRLAHERIALFVTVSDVDHSLQNLTNLFVTQAFQVLCAEADRCPGHRLPVPVRLYLDDFSNLRIADFSDYLAVIRSREIWCSVFCQTVSQLEATNGAAEANAIIGNCDTQLILGFQDANTAQYFSTKANVPASSLLQTPLGRSWLFVRGSGAEKVRLYDLTKHPRYLDGEPMDSDGGLAGDVVPSAS